MSEPTFFNQLSDQNSKEVLAFLVHNQTNLIVKVDKKHFKTKMLTKKNDREFTVYKFNFQNYQNEAVVCSFDIKDEKYFFKSIMKATNAELLISFPNEVFQLQRRNDFRVNIPTNVTYLCELKTVNKTRLNVMAELRDLSLGGCLVSVKEGAKLSIPADSEIEIHIKINDFDSPHIRTVAKHIKMIKGNDTLQLGLKYIDPMADFLRELQGLLVQLDRLHRKKTDD